MRPNRKEIADYIKLLRRNRVFTKNVHTVKNNNYYIKVFTVSRFSDYNKGKI